MGRRGHLLKWREPLGARPRCPKCAARLLLRVTALECPYCGYVQPRPVSTAPRQPESQDQALTESIARQIHESIERPVDADAGQFTQLEAPGETAFGRYLVVVLHGLGFAMLLLSSWPRNTPLNSEAALPFILLGLFGTVGLNAFALHSALIGLRNFVLGLCVLEVTLSVLLLLPPAGLAMLRQSLGLGNFGGSAYLVLNALTWLAAAWLHWIDLQYLRGSAPGSVERD